MDRERKALEWAARRAARRAAFIASALADYKATHGATEEQLARFLGCSAEALPALALCKRPDPSGKNFRPEAERVASFAGADATRLAQLLREVETAEALRDAARGREGTSDAGLLAAARDARTDEDQEYDRGDSEDPNDDHRSES